jgi:hypothetical protein
MKTTRNITYDSRSPGKDLKAEPPEYESGLLNIKPERSVDLCSRMVVSPQPYSPTFHTCTAIHSDDTCTLKQTKKSRVI